MNPLAIIGTGTVLPAHADSVPSLRDPARRFDVRRPDGAIFTRWRSEPRLRRASPITIFMAEAAAQALAGRRPGRLGIVGAFFSGGCHYSRLFFGPVLREGPSQASPALFPDTVYNSSVSHVAHLFGVSGPCYAVVGDDAAWITALDVAATWLGLDTVDHVLVLGAEELDAVTIEAYDAAGWLRKGFLPSEGAAALLLARDGEVGIDALHFGASHRSCFSARRAVAECFAAMDDGPILETAARTWMGPLEQELMPVGQVVPLADEPPGHAFTASAGWNTIRGARWLCESGADALWVPAWGLHDRVAALRLRPLAVKPEPG